MSKRMSSKIEVVAYANGDELANLLGDRTAAVAGVSDGWRSIGLVRYNDHQTEVDRLTEWGRANQQLAQNAMDKLEEALADCDRLQMHLADHRATLDAMSSCADSAAPVVEHTPVASVGYRARFIKEPGNWMVVWDRPLPTHHLNPAAEYQLIYTAPPELAELQALNEDALAVNKTLNQQMDALQDTVAQQAAEIERLKSESFESLYNDAVDEIERLKGGQGEPVAYLYTCTFDEYQDPEVRRAKFRVNVVTKGWIEEPLYTSQPAPVSAATYDDGFADGLSEASLNLIAPISVVHPFADKVIRKLQRFQECTEDGQGGRHRKTLV